jgi:hypothetical protein
MGMFATLRRLSKDPSFAQFVDGLLAENGDLDKATQGVLLGVDRYWHSWWSHLWEFEPPWRRDPPFRPSTDFDPFNMPKEYPSDWVHHLKGIGRSDDAKDPIEITFSLLPGTTTLGRWPRSWRQFGIRYEVRPRCTALGRKDAIDPLEGGISVGKLGEDGSGTLGGVLRDAGSLKKYVVSCAHVLGAAGSVVQPAEDDNSRRSRLIGTVNRSQLPPPRPPGLRRANSPSGTIDAALAELQVQTDAYMRIDTLGAVDRLELADSIDCFEDVECVGKESGLIEAETRQVCHIYQMDIEQQPRLFRDVFTIGPRTKQYLVTSLAQKGDSGAWVVSTAGKVNSWRGMLFGGDGLDGFCCFAENVQAAFGSQLVVR